jgi:hypothetical protein
MMIETQESLLESAEERRALLVRIADLLERLVALADGAEKRRQQEIDRQLRRDNSLAGGW